MKISLIFPKPPENGTFCGTVKEAEEYNEEKINFYDYKIKGLEWVSECVVSEDYLRAGSHYLT